MYVLLVFSTNCASIAIYLILQTAFHKVCTYIPHPWIQHHIRKLCLSHFYVFPLHVQANVLVQLVLREGVEVPCSDDSIVEVPSQLATAQASPFVINESLPSAERASSGLSPLPRA